MFVNTRLFSPVIYNGKTTAPKDSYEYNAWYDEEYDRCINGYTVAGTKITGPHYFYLNYWKIRAQKGEKNATKGLISPRFLDIDYDFFWEVQKAIEAGEDLMCLKRRQAGFSYKSGCLIGHEAMFVPDSYSIITAGEKKFSNKTFKDCSTGLHLLHDTEFFKNRLISNTEKMRFGYQEEINGAVAEMGYLSEIHNIVGTDPQALVGTSASKILYEEVGMYKGIKDTKAYADPSMEVNGRKTGFQLLIGTGGEENTAIDEVTDMYYDPTTYGLRAYTNDWDDDEVIAVSDAMEEGNKTKVCFFIPGYKYLVIDDDGNSLIDESKKLLMERREKKKRDKKSWLKEVTQFPINPEEALMVPDGNQFNAQKLREQLGRILKYKENQDRLRLGHIEWVHDDNGRVIGTEWIDAVDMEDPTKAHYRMIEAPYVDPQTKKVPRGLYVAGTDSYDKDKVASTHGSFGSCYMMKTFSHLDATNDLPVCSLTHRPDTSAEFYEMTAKMCVHYGWAMNLVEYSNLLIGEWYNRNGFGGLLMERPEVAYAMTIESKSQNRWGVETTTKEYWLQAAADYIEEHYTKIWDPVLIKALLKYKKAPDYNCDRTIAFSLSVIHRDNVIHMMKKPKRMEPAQRWDLGIRTVVRGGRLVRL